MWRRAYCMVGGVWVMGYAAFWRTAATTCRKYRTSNGVIREVRGPVAGRPTSRSPRGLRRWERGRRRGPLHPNPEVPADTHGPPAAQITAHQLARALGGGHPQARPLHATLLRIQPLEGREEPRDLLRQHARAGV